MQLKVFMMIHEEMIAVLKKQRDLLARLIMRLERKTILNDTDRRFYDAVTKRVERNLHELRKPKTNFLPNRHEEEFPASFHSF